MAEKREVLFMWQIGVWEQEEGLAGHSGYPVRVAASGVKELPGALAGIAFGEFDQLVFDFEWAHLGELFFFFSDC